MTQALAVARYTLVELSRRRVLQVIVGIGVVLTAGLALAPHLLPGNDTDATRLIVTLTGLEEIVPNALLFSALAIGMTVINHDLDSGAIVSILSKPVSRASYTVGKLLASVGSVLLIAAIFTGGSLVDAALNGGGVYSAVFWAGVVISANSLLLLLLVITLTVYMNNIVAAAIVFAFNYAAGNVLTLYAMVQHNRITNSVGRAVVEVAYWVVPHELTSNLERQIMQLKLDAGIVILRGAHDAFADIPGASSAVDVVFWLGYVAAISALLFWSVSRKEV